MGSTVFIITKWDNIRKDEYYESSGFAKFKSMEEYLEWYQHCTYAEINEEILFSEKLTNCPEIQNDYRSCSKSQRTVVQCVSFYKYYFYKLLMKHISEKPLKSVFPDLKSYCLYGSQYEDGFKVAYWGW